MKSFCLYLGLLLLLISPKLILAQKKRLISGVKFMNEMPQDSSATFNYIDPDGKGHLINIYYPLNQEPYALAPRKSGGYIGYGYIYTTPEGRYIPFEEYNFYRGMATFVEWKRIPKRIDTILVIPPKANAEAELYKHFNSQLRQSLNREQLKLLENSLGVRKEGILVLNFWFLNCPSCRKEIPALNTLQNKFQSSTLRFIGFSLDPAEQLEHSAIAQNFHYELIANSMAIAKAFKVQSYPSHIIIDQKGVIRYLSYESSAEALDELEKALTQIIQE